jgi:uncharacterized membrane protein
MAENPNARLETFCDGVFAIALTLLIIDIKIPSTESIHTNGDLWLTLKHLMPSIFAFVLSFVTILITWVNHHNLLKLVHKTSSHFMYANGFLLLAVVIVPFPTALLGDNVFTDHAAPAVIIYSAIFAVQAIGWILISTAALSGEKLTKNERATQLVRENRKQGYYAFTLYTICAIVATWFPLTIAIVVAVSWIVWLIIGINLKEE